MAKRLTFDMVLHPGGDESLSLEVGDHQQVLGWEILDTVAGVQVVLVTSEDVPDRQVGFQAGSDG